MIYKFNSERCINFFLLEPDVGMPHCKAQKYFHQIIDGVVSDLKFLTVN